MDDFHIQKTSFRTLYNKKKKNNNKINQKAIFFVVLKTKINEINRFRIKKQKKEK